MKLTLGRRLQETESVATTDVDVLTGTRDFFEITKIFIANTTGGAITFRIHHRPPSTAAAASNALYYDVSLAANTTREIDFAAGGRGIALAENEVLSIHASAVGLTFTTYGEKVDMGARR